MHPTLLTAACLAAWLGLAMAPAAQAGTVLIDNVTLIDAVHGQRDGMRVLLSEGRIASVQPAAAVPPAAERVLDGSGHYLLPGLWDMHVHYSFDTALGPAMPAMLLAHGITAVRDTGGPLAEVLAWSRHASDRPLDTPAYYFSGPLLDGRPSVYDGSAPGYPNMSLSVSTPAEAAHQVDRLAAAGAALIKAYEMLQPDVFEAIIDQAANHGLPVTGHVPLGMTSAQVATAGIASLEHLRNLELDCSSQASVMLQERRDLLTRAGDSTGSDLRRQAHAAHRIPAIEALDWPRCVAMLEHHHARGVRHVPTLSLILSVYEKLHTGAEWRAGFDQLPHELRDDWLRSSEAMGKLFENDPEGDTGRAAYLAWVRRVVSWMADKHMLLAGTDTPLFFMTPGLSLHAELEAMVQAGLTPLQALEAATLSPARYFGLDGTAGSIGPGHRADLLLLSGNPLADIRHTRSIRAVIRGGHVHDRDDLDALLAEARSQKQAPQASPE
jgi:imidazolonepropionase-like amidohydrolase